MNHGLQTKIFVKRRYILDDYVINRGRGEFMKYASIIHNGNDLYTRAHQLINDPSSDPSGNIVIHQPAHSTQELLAVCKALKRESRDPQNKLLGV